MTKKENRRPAQWTEFMRWVLADHGRTHRLLSVLRTILAAGLLVGVLVSPEVGPALAEVARSLGAPAP